VYGLFESPLLPLPPHPRVAGTHRFLAVCSRFKTFSLVQTEITSSRMGPASVALQRAEALHSGRTLTH
jgi:hypothetical protein